MDNNSSEVRFDKKIPNLLINFSLDDHLYVKNTGSGASAQAGLQHSLPQTVDQPSTMLQLQVFLKAVEVRKKSHY